MQINTYQFFNTTEGDLLLCLQEIESFLFDPQIKDTCMIRTKSDKTYEISATKGQIIEFLEKFEVI